VQLNKATNGQGEDVDSEQEDHIPISILLRDGASKMKKRKWQESDAYVPVDLHLSEVSKSKKQGIVKAEAEFNGCLDATLSSIADGAVVASYDDESGNPRPIYKESLQRLASNRGAGSWLDDTLVDVMIRHYTAGTSVKLVKNTYFYEAMLREARIHVITTLHATDVEILLFTICKNDHWYLIAADTTSSTLLIYDPLCGIHEDDAKRIEAWLIEESIAYSSKHPGECGWQQEAWKIEHVFTEVQQQNGFDCGVFLLGFVKALSQGEHPQTFTQGQCLQLRLEVLDTLISQGDTEEDAGVENANKAQ